MPNLRLLMTHLKIHNNIFNLHGDNKSYGLNKTHDQESHGNYNTKNYEFHAYHKTQD